MIGSISRLYYNRIGTVRINFKAEIRKIYPQYPIQRLMLIILIAMLVIYSVAFIPATFPRLRYIGMLIEIMVVVVDGILLDVVHLGTVEDDTFDVILARRYCRPRIGFVSDFSFVMAQFDFLQCQIINPIPSGYRRNSKPTSADGLWTTWLPFSWYLWKYPSGSRSLFKFRSIT